MPRLHGPKPSPRLTLCIDDDCLLQRGLYDEGSRDSAEDDDVVHEEDVGLTENQQRLLYLISLHSGPAMTSEESERWVRHQSLMVLVYEGVVAQAFDYDYAPASEMVEGRRMFFNVSQEGKSDLDYLREEKLVNGLKISSRDHLPVTMYQISRRGLDVLRGVDQYDRDAVHTFALSPSRALMQVEFANSEFWLVAAEGGASAYRKKSSVLAIEEVSYVSSAYIPACLRHGGRPTLSNAHRVHECTSSAGGTIRDDLDEVITLNSVSLIVGEYIPFGSNQMVQLNHTMGSPERVLGGFYTAAVQDDASSAGFHMDPGLTAIQILDYSLAGHVNLEADIQLPEPDGIVQIETFGVSVNSNGSCFFGLQLEAVMDRVKDAISLDHLARLLVDVQTDSSEIVEPMLSPSQRRILDMVYRGDSANRNKVNLIIANEITPHLQAEEYMDKGEFENELKQVLGDTRAAYGISDSDTLIFGANGLLLAGPNSRTYEPLLCSYVQLLSMDLFAQNLFNIIAMVQDDIRATASQCRLARRDPMLLREAVGRLPTLLRRVLLLEKIMSFMEESLLSTELPEPPLTAAGRALYDRLALPQLQSEMARRVTDLSKFLKETTQELRVTERLAGQVQEDRDRDMMREIESHAMALRESSRSPVMPRAVYLLEMLQWLLTSLVCFASLDRFSGEWTVVDSDWFRAVAQALIVRGPMVWFLLSFLLFIGVGYLLSFLYYRRSKRFDENLTQVKLEIRQAMSQANLDRFLAPKRVLRTTWDLNSEGDLVSVAWIEEMDFMERWSGVRPQITLTYSAQLSQVIRVDVEFQRNLIPDRAASLSAQDIRDRIMALLETEGILVPDEFAPELVMGPSEAAKEVKNKRKLFARPKTDANADDEEVVPPAPFSRMAPSDGQQQPSGRVTAADMVPADKSTSGKQSATRPASDDAAIATPTSAAKRPTMAAGSAVAGSGSATSREDTPAGKATGRSVVPSARPPAASGGSAGTPAAGSSGGGAAGAGSTARKPFQAETGSHTGGGSMVLPVRPEPTSPHAGRVTGRSTQRNDDADPDSSARRLGPGAAFADDGDDGDDDDEKEIARAEA